MKKLLLVSLVLGVLVVFSGVAMAAAPTVEVFTSCKSVKTTTCAPISFPVQLIKESQTTADVITDVPRTTLPVKTRTFTGFLVVNLDFTSEAGVNDIAIPEVFFCGTITSGSGTPTPVQIDFTSFATALSDVKSGRLVSAAVDMIGTGEFFMPPTASDVGAVGIDYLNASVTGVFSPTTNRVTAIRVSGKIAGGISNPDLTTDLETPADTGLFSAVFSNLTLLKNTTLTACTTGATCSALGVVECAP
jgi:hypothetical protein